MIIMNTDMMFTMCQPCSLYNPHNNSRELSASNMSSFLWMKMFHTQTQGQNLAAADSLMASRHSAAFMLCSLHCGFPRVGHVYVRSVQRAHQTLTSQPLCRRQGWVASFPLFSLLFAELVCWRILIQEMNKKGFETRVRPRQLVFCMSDKWPSVNKLFDMKLLSLEY